MSCKWMLQRGHSGDGCVLASTLSKYDLRKGDLFVLSLQLVNTDQINLTFLNHTYTKSTPNHIHHHYGPSVTLTHTTHIIFSTARTYAPLGPPGFVDRPRRSDGTAAKRTEKLGGGT